MDSDFTIGGVSIFYLVPVLVFGPLMALGLWNFGLKDLFRRDQEVDDRIRQEQERREAEARRRLEKAGGLAPRPVTEPPTSAVSWIGRAVAYGAFAGFLGVFSAWPSYGYWPGDAGQLKLSITIAGERKAACRKLSREELMKLPPNMRRPEKCSRERHPVRIRITVDDQDLFAGTQPPAGLSGDGNSSFYHKFSLPTGGHRITATLSLDDGGSVTSHLDRSIHIQPGQVMVLGFDSVNHGLALQ